MHLKQIFAKSSSYSTTLLRFFFMRSNDSTRRETADRLSAPWTPLTSVLISLSIQLRSRVCRALWLPRRHSFLNRRCLFMLLLFLKYTLLKVQVWGISFRCAKIFFIKNEALVCISKNELIVFIHLLNLIFCPLIYESSR